MKKVLLSTILSAFLSIAIINTAFAEIMLFVGDGCPHCTNVEAYIEENNVLDRLPVTVYEVWNNTANQPLFIEKTQEVGYEGQGVPFMVDGNHYEVGDYPIIGYLEDLLENQGDPMAEKIKKDSIPVTAEAAITADDSEELNEIMEEKTAEGEKSELVDPSTLYDAANGLGEEVEVAEESSETTDLNKQIIYGIAAIALISLVAGFYSRKKRKGKNRK